MKDNFSILIVDDSIMSVSHLSRILTKVGYNVHAVHSGEEALDYIKTSIPDMILLDIIMPGMDGFEVIKRLKTDNEAHDIPVIFLTASDDQDSKVKAFDLGAVDYIVKPFYPQEVKARVKVHLKMITAMKSIIENQADKMRQIREAQESILLKPSDLPEAKFSVLFTPMAEAGGDFYDVIKIAGDLYSYFVADVSGHDIATSYINPAVKALLRQNSSPIYSPEDTIEMMSKVLFQTLPGDKYLTAFYLTLNRRSNKVNFINAGHPPAIYIPVGGEPVILDSDIDGDLIGMFDNTYYRSTEIPVNKGDRIILYTDGLLETLESHTVWTAQYHKLLSVVRDIKDAKLDELPQLLFNAIISDPGVMDDDVIIMALEV